MFCFVCAKFLFSAKVTVKSCAGKIGFKWSFLISSPVTKSIVTDDWKNKEFHYLVGTDVRFATFKIKLTKADINFFLKKTKRISFNAAFQTKQVWHSYVFNVDVCHVLQEKGELISVCSKLKVLIFRSKLGYWTSFEILYHFGWNWMKKGCACHQNMKLVMRACQI